MARRLRWVACAVMALFMSAGGPAHAATVNVEVGSDYFKAKAITVNRGDTVTWTWVGGTHNVRSTTPAGVLYSDNLQKPSTWSHTFNEAPGTYQYECTRHSGMTGSVTVVGADTTPPPAPTASPRGGTYRSTQSVSLSDTESGATIRYTTDGSTPTTSSTAYSAPITVNSSRTIKAIAVDGTGNASPVTTETYTIDTTPPPAPTASPASGTYRTTQTVSLADTESGATIRYTTDGSAPNAGSTRYTAPISVPATTTIKAIALDAAGNASPVASFAYTINNGVPATPTPSPAAGAYRTAQNVALTAQSGMTIRYTTDGTTPGASSTRYTAPISVATTTTIKTIAIDSGGAQSPVGTYAYVIDSTPPAAPAATPAPGAYNGAQDVTLADTDPDAAVYYTTNGTTPTTSSSVYSTPIHVASSTTIKALAVDRAGNQSGVSTFTYTIDTTAPPAPTADPAPGAYANAQTVTLADSESAAAIHYTTDGTAPTASSPRYTGPITVDRSSTVRAVAVDAVGNESPASSFDYVIDTTAPPAPTADPAPGTFGSARDVSLSDAESGASIHFTTDGSAPTASSPEYSGPISVSQTTTIKAVALDAVGNASPIASLRYVIDTVAPPTPTASVAPGRYETAQDVALSVADPDATIRYTTDGTDATPASPPYSAPIHVDGPTTINAIAVDAAGNVSEPVSFGYVVSAPPAATARVVEVGGYVFSPGDIVINKGETVTWEWSGPDFNHNVTADDGSFASHPGVPDSQVGAPPGGKFEHRFDTVGTYSYICTLHPEDMHATVTVVESGAPTDQSQQRPTTSEEPASVPATTTAPQQGARNWDVDVANMKFTPDALTVEQGDSVTWRWTGADVNHSVTSDPNQPERFESHPGVSLAKLTKAPPGGAFSHTFTQLGKTSYFCRLHPDMKGTITVVPRGTAKATSQNAPLRLARARARVRGRRLVMTLTSSAASRLRLQLWGRARGAKRSRRLVTVVRRARRGTNTFRVTLPTAARRHGTRLRVVVAGTDTAGNRARPLTVSVLTR